MPVLLPLLKYALWHVLLKECGKLKCKVVGCHPTAKKSFLKIGQALQELKLEIHRYRSHKPTLFPF
jgi:hypothetical protein